MPKSAQAKKQVFIRMSETDRQAGQFIAKKWGMIESEFWRQFAGIYPEGTQPDMLRTNKLRHEYDEMRAKLKQRR